MSNVERTYDKDGWIEDSYMWYVNNCGAKWVSVDEWDYPRLQGYSAWSHPVQLVENLLEYASKRFNVELSAIMTYEDEFRNFIGRDNLKLIKMTNTTVYIVKNTLMVVI